MRTTLLLAGTLASLACTVERGQPVVAVVLPTTEFSRCNSGFVTSTQKFLEVRGGPGVTHPLIDSISNGRTFIACNERGDWIGIVYGSEDCWTKLQKVRTFDLPNNCRSGWISRTSAELTNG